MELRGNGRTVGQGRPFNFMLIKQGKIMIARYARIFMLVAIAATLSGALQAQSDQGLDSRVFGLGQPATVGDLPPGHLKRKIQSLPPQARGKALGWLQDFSFPAVDVDSLDVDAEGGILYVEPNVVEAGDEAASSSEPGTEAAPQSTLDDAFLLHSKPGATNTVFLDFDGDSFTDTAWGSGTFNAKPYSTDSDFSTFSETERRKIVDIWHRVAEDLAPFDIDVTTEEPADFDPYTGHVLITASTQSGGGDMPHPDAGGVAYVNVFGRYDYHTRYSPALVYFDNLGNGVEHYVAEASSHEFGHNLGLSHDGTSTTGYYTGHGNGVVSWAPIMGVGYYQNVTQWSIGEYSDANNSQDDLNIIDGKLGYAADDHGDTVAAASALSVDASGNVVSSNPELDPHNVLFENKGIIGDSSDVDVFSFLTGPGQVSLTVTPAWDAFTRSDLRGANLDVLVELRDVNNVLIASDDPLDETNATVTASVGAGSYYLLITGVGNNVTPYSDYGSHGMYFIEGTVQPTAPDENAPNPDPMGFEVDPVATGPDTITMTALEAIDDVSAVQYEFRCQFGGNGCVGSTIQSSRVYTPTGLDPDTEYTFSVLAMDQSDNKTVASAWISATTEALPDWVDYFSASDTPVAGSVSGTHTLTHDDDFYAQSFTERESGGKPANRHSYMEHRWNFNLPAGASAEVRMNAYKSTDNPDESFDIEVSTDGGSNWTFLMKITSTSDSNLQTAMIPGAPSGSVILRVVDKHRQSGDRVQSRFHVDHLCVRVGSPPTDPPDLAPSGLTATAISSSQIDLGWTDNASNESSYKVERSADGSEPWTEIAELPAGAESYSDTGLSALTTYHYRVLAWNPNGSLVSNTASDETPVGEPEPDLNLQASGYKQKGQHGVVLTWTGADSVDIYFNGNPTALRSGVSGGSFDHSIGNKGGASYTHQVCEAGTSNCSNTTTTVF